MTHQYPLRLLALLMAGTVALPGCQLFRHHRATGCREPQVALNVDNLPPIRVPEGLDPPDTRNTVRIPELNEPERARAATEPCLSEPPNFGSAPLIEQPVQKVNPAQLHRAMSGSKEKEK